MAVLTDHRAPITAVPNITGAGWVCGEGGGGVDVNERRHSEDQEDERCDHSNF